MYDLIVVGGGPAADTAPRMVKEGLRLLWN